MRQEAGSWLEGAIDGWRQQQKVGQTGFYFSDWDEAAAVGPLERMRSEG